MRVSWRPIAHAKHGSRCSAWAPSTHSKRSFGTSTPVGKQKPSIEPATSKLSSRWLSDVQQRMGKCILFGLKPHQTAEAGSVLGEIAHDWRDLVAGSEGFLTSKDRRGLFRQAVVWGEMDSMMLILILIDEIGHVNNVVYNRYAESARIVWASNYANNIDPKHAKEWRELWTPKGVGLILRSIKTDFKFPMKFPDHVTVYHKLRSEPTSETDSFVLDVLILSELHRRTAARCVEDIVVYDYRKGKKAPLHGFMAEQFRETWRLQEEAKKRNSERVVGLLDRVRALETDTWDRPDAVEDLGSAT